MDDIVNSVPSWMFTAIIAVCILFIIGIIFARLYRRASAEQAFVRTGLSGQKVVMSGGAIVMPIFHEIIPINMNTLKLEVSRSTIDSLITKDRMRVDVVVAFFVRVKTVCRRHRHCGADVGATHAITRRLTYVG